MVAGAGTQQVGRAEFLQVAQGDGVDGGVKQGRGMQLHRPGDVDHMTIAAYALVGLAPLHQGLGEGGRGGLWRVKADFEVLEGLDLLGLPVAGVLFQGVSRIPLVGLALMLEFVVPGLGLLGKPETSAELAGLHRHGMLMVRRL